MLAKQVWHLIGNPNSLVALFLKSKYFPYHDILEVSDKPGSSFLWRSLLWGREALKLGLRWRIDNGHNINIYSDPWIPRNNSFQIFFHPVLELSKVQDLIGANSGWNEALVIKISPLIPLLSLVYFCIVWLHVVSSGRSIFYVCQEYCWLSFFLLSYISLSFVFFSFSLYLKWALCIPSGNREKCIFHLYFFFSSSMVSIVDSFAVFFPLNGSCRSSSGCSYHHGWCQQPLFSP